MTADQTRDPVPARTVLLAIVTVVLVVAGLKLSRPVTLPVVAGIFLVVLTWPLRQRLARHVPSWLATLLAFFGVLAVFAAFVAALIWMGGKIGDAGPRYGAAVSEASAGVSRWLSERGLPAPSGGLAESDWVSNLAQSAARDLFSMLALIGLLFGFFGLGLAEVSAFRERARTALERPQTRKLFETMGEIAEQWRRYIVAKTVTCALTGTLTGLFCLLVGLDLALVWGFLSFLLEYVPTVGSTIAVIPPSLFAVVQFGFGAKAVLVFVGIAAIQLTMGNFVDPRIEGRFLTVSPVLILFAIVFWGWVWGAIGALLGVPITAAVLIACRHFESTRWIAAMLIREQPDR